MSTSQFDAERNINRIQHYLDEVLEDHANVDESEKKAYLTAILQLYLEETRHAELASHINKKFKEIVENLAEELGTA